MPRGVIPAPHTFHYEDEKQPDGTVVRRPVLDDPERFRRETLLSGAYQREAELEQELVEVRRDIKNMKRSAGGS